MTGGRDRLEVGLAPLTAQYSLPMGEATSIPALSCRCSERSEVLRGKRLNLRVVGVFGLRSDHPVILVVE